MNYEAKIWLLGSAFLLGGFSGGLEGLGLKRSGHFVRAR